MMKTNLGSAVLLFAFNLSCSSSDAGTPQDVAGSGGAASPTAGSNAGGNSAAGMTTTSPGGSATGGSPGSAGMTGTAGNVATGGGGTGAGTGGMPPVIPVGETPEAKWVDITGNLAGMASECGNLGRVSAHPYSDMLVVGIAKKGLFSSKNGGASWEPLGTTGATITNRISWLAYDPTAPMTFWESGIYNDGGVYKTTDNGASFTQVGDVKHCDSVSLDFSDPARKTMLAGSHEQSQKLFRSVDGGAQWQDIGSKLPAGSGFCTISLILDAKTFVVGCGGWYGGTPGIQRSIDGGDSFQQVSDKGVAGQPLLASDGTIYWAGHQAGGLYKSTDQGKTFSQVADQNQARSVEPIELPDGRIVTIGGKTLMISANQGQTWEPIADELPWVPSGVSYSAYRNSFFVWRWDCGNVVLAESILRFGYDYRK